MPIDGSVTDLELKPNGSFAWIAELGKSVTVSADDSAGTRRLDRGRGIARRSLALSGSALTWRKDGVTHSAVLD